MRLTYETGVATLLQFIILSLLNILNTIVSIVSSCRNSNTDCVANMLTSIIIYLLLVAWFGFIAGLGYITQNRRSRRAAKYLIGAEIIVFLIAALNIKQGISSHSGALSLFTSLTDTILAAWVISLALRLRKAHGGRVRRRNYSPEK